MDTGSYSAGALPHPLVVYRRHRAGADPRSLPVPTCLLSHSTWRRSILSGKALSYRKSAAAGVALFDQLYSVVRRLRTDGWTSSWSSRSRLRLRLPERLGFRRLLDNVAEVMVINALGTEARWLEAALRSEAHSARVCRYPRTLANPASGPSVAYMHVVAEAALAAMLTDTACTVPITKLGAARAGDLTDAGMDEIVGGPRCLADLRESSTAVHGDFCCLLSRTNHTLCAVVTARRVRSSTDHLKDASRLSHSASLLNPTLAWAFLLSG